MIGEFNRGYLRQKMVCSRSGEHGYDSYLSRDAEQQLGEIDQLSSKLRFATESASIFPEIPENKPAW